MFANVLDLATVAAHCVWFEADSLAKKDARSPFIQCTSKSLMLTYMKRRPMQTNIERAFLQSDGLSSSQKGTKVCKCQVQVGSGKPVVSQEHQVKLPAHRTRGKPVVSQ